MKTLNDYLAMSYRMRARTRAYIRGCQSHFRLKNHSVKESFRLEEYAD